MRFCHKLDPIWSRRSEIISSYTRTSTKKEKRKQIAIATREMQVIQRPKLETNLPEY